MTKISIQLGQLRFQARIVEHVEGVTLLLELEVLIDQLLRLLVLKTQRLNWPLEASPCLQQNTSQQVFFFSNFQAQYASYENHNKGKSNILDGIQDGHGA